MKTLGLCASDGKKKNNDDEQTKFLHELIFNLMLTFKYTERLIREFGKLPRLFNNLLNSSIKKLYQLNQGDFR
jgi:hypothetical protein